VVTIPAGISAPEDAAPALDKLTGADAVAAARRDSDAAMEEVAATKPVRAKATTDVEKCILGVVLVVRVKNY